MAKVQNAISLYMTALNGMTISRCDTQLLQ